MKPCFLFFIIIFIYNFSNAQMPFESKTVVKYKTDANLFSSLNANPAVQTSNALIIDKKKIVHFDFTQVQTAAINQQSLNEIQASNKENNESFGVFDQATASLVISDNVDKLFPTINGDIIKYKLGVWSKVKANLDTVRIYLPFNLISKVSGNYKNNGTGTLNDATSFFGAPLTFRASPAFKIAAGAENTLVLGTIQDLRLLTIGDTSVSKLQAAFGYYGAIGLTYFGKGAAIDVDQSEHEGSWSFSALLYWFMSNGEFNKSIFGDYQKKTLSGLELLLKFTPFAKADSKFGFVIGAENGFTRGAPNFGKWNFRIGIGN